MSNYHATTWDQTVDQNGRPCWVNRHAQHATYQLQDSNGIPFHHFPTTWPVQPAPMATNCFAPQPVHMGMGSFPQPPARTVAIVGEKVKPDKWTEYCDEKTGNKYYHNPGLGKTQWDKPEDFDKQENAGKPKPPDDPPKKEKPRGKYELPPRCTC
ncbi:unnamed protein product [Scytosiphon promiscuus]